MLEEAYFSIEIFLNKLNGLLLENVNFLESDALIDCRNGQCFN